MTNKYLFAGEQYDQNLGDYYLRARYYNSETGQFTRRDLYEGNFNAPSTLHRYVYAGNNPVNSIDPTGLFTIGEFGAAESIRNILAGTQAASGGYLISATLKGGDYQVQDFLQDFAVDAALTLVPLALPLIPKFAKLLSRVLGSLQSGSGKAGLQIPSTGNAMFDILGARTSAYPQWTGNLAARGFTVVEEPLEIGTHATFRDTRTLVVDPAQFTYLDLLHESRHVAQIERSLQAGQTNILNRQTISMFEKGAYEYELKLVQKYNFSQEYQEFAKQRINDYWDRSMRQKYSKSPSFQARYSETWK